MKKVSPRQQVVLSEIKAFLIKKGYSPSVRELAAILNIQSPSTVHAHLQSLKRKGMIDWEPDRPRTLRIIEWEERRDAI
ncbi:HTH domain-containing protein [Cohnella lubricantis]|uniref:HTH domain-containing protein n=1 Tax=Cohnella lubricantis TaxID=2163172 RepID=A0A841TBF7_9BACL|nr:HTH domain-containing protein [Cohnella lubricantis]MBB6677436.1 HTH domain-containing protein [Cohnella lubricantis]MBP2117516.1 repressor LexA [Cohnella lubricantis]